MLSSNTVNPLRTNFETNDHFEGFGFNNDSDRKSGSSQDPIQNSQSHVSSEQPLPYNSSHPLINHNHSHHCSSSPIQDTSWHAGQHTACTVMADSMPSYLAKSAMFLSIIPSIFLIKPSRFTPAELQ
ncbi:hypothetical protein QQP08_001861 [Theobroma cacao]|nr:hypothetical protein QQP08_001861 [Theobroma cacao]